jgi:DNA recombination protein RmuC
MQGLILGIVAAFVGILVGFWLRGASSKAEKTQREQRAQELVTELAGVRVALTEAQAESAARAGFESLAGERSQTIAQLTADRDSLNAVVAQKTAAEAQALAKISGLQAELNAERAGLQEKLAMLETAKQTLANQFEALAGEVLEKKSKSFSEGSQRELGTLLTPLRTQIEEFRKKVEDAQKDSLVGRTQLSEKLEQLRGLNERLSTEAQALTNALTRDTGEQGHWGELVLLDILEDCDLKRGLHYTYQQTFIADGENGLREERKRTDVILRFPEGRSLIIDSKVTLSAHKDFVDATDDATRKNALDRLVASIRTHVRELAAKNYQELLGEKSPDYVVLFAPNEAAYLLAVQADSKLITDGYKSRVLIAGPTTILHIARIVESLWRNEERSKSLQQVGERARLLYEEFTRFVDALETVRTSILKAAAEIHNAEQSHDEAMKRLTSGRGNLVSQAEKLGKLGNKSAKQIASRVLEMAEEETESPLSLAAEADDSGA